MPSRITAALAALLVPLLSAWPGQPNPAPPDLRPAGTVARFVIDSQGNEARYRVREQLARVNLPSDAVGVTTRLSGALVLGDDGQVQPADSRITADLTTLKSDRERRDMYLQRRTLETERFPTAELMPTKLRGLSWPLPASGMFTFELDGNLTLHGVTRPTTWKVDADAAAGGFTGHAATGFTFDDFGLEKPKVMMVLSVDDSIHLEYDFRLRRQ